MRRVVCVVRGFRRPRVHPSTPPIAPPPPGKLFRDAACLLGSSQPPVPTPTSDPTMCRYVATRFTRLAWGSSGPIRSNALEVFRREGPLGEEDFADARETLASLLDSVNGE